MPEPEPELVRAPLRRSTSHSEALTPSAQPTAPQRPVQSRPPVIEEHYEPEDIHAQEAVQPTAGMKKTSRRQWLIVGGFVAVAAVVFGALGVQAFGGSGEESKPSLDAQLAATSAAEAPTSTSASPSAAPAAVKFSCAEKSEGDTVTGAGAGDTASVPGVILAFEDAYYNARDAKKALSLTAPESPLKDADAMQKAIDQMPGGTKHCVSVRAAGDNATVELTEAVPGEEPVTIDQKFTTKRDGDKVSIVDVTEG